MGCGCGLINPYEKCAFLLKDFNILVLQRKELVENNMTKEKKKTDTKALNYQKNILNNLQEINKKSLNRIETQKLKQLNELFVVLLSEESNLKKNNNSNNIEEDNLDKNEILITCTNNNKINERNKNIISSKKNKTGLIN